MALAVPAMSVCAQDHIRDSVELEPVVVTASHTPKALKDAPVVTRLITLHDIKINDATNIQDMLIQEIPGLEFGFAMSQETSLNMSGFGGNAVLFLVDGERMAGETMDNVDYSRMSLDNASSTSSAARTWSPGRQTSIRDTAPSGMNGATELASRSTPGNGTRRPLSSTPKSTPSTCLRRTLPKRWPPS